MAELTRAHDGRLAATKVAVLMESDFVEPEIFYYERRFAEEGIQVDFLTRLWGQPSMTFTGHEHRAPFTVASSFEGLSDDDLRRYAAVIVPGGMVSDRLRYTDDVQRLAPATELMRRAFSEPSILKGIICHGLWLMASAPETVRGRKLVAHNNLLGDVRNMGAEYVDQDVVVDDDFVSGRSAAHCHLFAHTLISLLLERNTAS